MCPVSECTERIYAFSHFTLKSTISYFTKKISWLSHSTNFTTKVARQSPFTRKIMCFNDEVTHDHESEG